MPVILLVVMEVIPRHMRPLQGIIGQRAGTICMFKLRNTAGQSSVKTVFVEIDNSTPDTPDENSILLDILNSNTHRLRVTFRDLMSRDQVEIFTSSNCASGRRGRATVGNNQNEAMIELTASSTRRDYYARVTNSVGNRSGFAVRYLLILMNFQK